VAWKGNRCYDPNYIVKQADGTFRPCFKAEFEQEWEVMKPPAELISGETYK